MVNDGTSPFVAERELIDHDIRRFVATTLADDGKKRAPSTLNRELFSDDLNRKRVSDITPIPTDVGEFEATNRTFTAFTRFRHGPAVVQSQSCLNLGHNGMCMHSECLQMGIDNQ